MRLIPNLSPKEEERRLGGSLRHVIPPSGGWEALFATLFLPQGGWEALFATGSFSPREAGRLSSPQDLLS